MDGSHLVQPSVRGATLDDVKIAYGVAEVLHAANPDRPQDVSEPAFDAKRERDRTQADVDQYNKAADEMNKASAEFNATNKQLFESRNKQIENWNKASQTFLDKHTPQYK